MSRLNASPMLMIIVLAAVALVAHSIIDVGVSLAYLALPLLALTAISWFAWRVWGRVFWRANHIAHIRERRLLDEAARR